MIYSDDFFMINDIIIEMIEYQQANLNRIMTVWTLNFINF